VVPIASIHLSIVDKAMSIRSLIVREYEVPSEEQDL
jgi:hypothetical protein